MLSDFEKSRSNNFTLMRFIFAWAVLIGHSFPITGNGSDPISKLLLPYTWIGGIAVSGFFAISGYLVTASFMQRTMPTFIASRLLRLYPAVIVYSLIAILLIGPLNIDVSVNQYFRANPWNNMLNAMLWEWTYNLPYVFPDNPFPGSTNGSTWTLPAEIRCYVLVFFLGFFGVFDSRIRANAFLFMLFILVEVSYVSIPLFGNSSRFASPLLFFLLGSLFWVNRSSLPLSWLLVVAATIALFFSNKSGFFYHYLYPVALTYIVFMFVYRTPHFDMDRFGDISYGVYIYAWPIQQMVWSQGQSAYLNILISTFIVFPLAYLSWRFIEKPALNIRQFLFSSNKNNLGQSNITFTVMKKSWQENLVLSWKPIFSGLALCCVIGFIYSTTGKLDAINQKDAVNMTPPALKGYEGTNFGNLFTLSGLDINCDAGGLNIKLAWKSKVAQKLCRTNAIHLINDAGEILGQADYKQSIKKQGVEQGQIWLDTILIPGDKLNVNMKKLAIGIYDDSNALLLIDQDNTDWGGHRLIIPIDKCPEKS